MNRLEYHPEDYFKCWEGSEQGMLYYRLKELEGYFTGWEEQEAFQTLVGHLEEAVKTEVPVQIE